MGNVLMERIVAAAIRVYIPKVIREELGFRDNDPEYLIISAPPPARHHNLMQPFYLRFGQHIGVSTTQGFLTSEGQYASRENAFTIARAAGQAMINHPSRVEGVLFSEDLW